MIDSPFDRAAAAAAFLRDRIDVPARVAVVLGSGLGAIADHVDSRVEVPFDDLPGFPSPTVAGHAGRFVGGTLLRTPVLLQCGRVHAYEGHDPDTVVLATRALAAFGIRVLIHTNAAGGLDPAMRPGDVMLVEDHLNLTGANPLRGPHDPRLGPRFVDLSAAYDHAVLRALEDAARRVGVALRRGVYAAVAGPSYETPAEVRMLRSLGADAVGMSTVPEVIEARQRGLRVGAISLITNRAAGLAGAPLSHEEVEREAARASVAIGNLLAEALADLARLAAD